MRSKERSFAALERDCFCSADAEDSRDDRATADVFVNAYGKLTSDIETNTGGPSPSRPSIGYGGEYGNYTDPETGLLCLGHRYYDPGTGRFLNRDPIGYNGGINLYGYAGNNPVNGMDPEGTTAAALLPLAARLGLSELIPPVVLRAGSFVGGITAGLSAGTAAILLGGADALGELGFDIAKGHSPGPIAYVGGIIADKLIPPTVINYGPLFAEEKPVECPDYEAAMKEALAWLAENGVTPDKAFLGRQIKGVIEHGGVIGVGIATEDNKAGLRLEWDTINGAHINVFDWNRGKGDQGKGIHFNFPGTAHDVLQKQLELIDKHG